LEGKSIGSDPKKKKQELKGELMILENQDAKLGFKGRSNSRIQFASNESKLVSRNLDIGPHGKWS
jgi:hypothetical protein